MAAPFVPDDFKVAVVESTDNLALALKKTFVIFPPLFYRFIKWFVSSEGGFTDQVNDALCGIRCGDSNT